MRSRGLSQAVTWGDLAQAAGDPSATVHLPDEKVNCFLQMGRFVTEPMPDSAIMVTGSWLREPWGARARLTFFIRLCRTQAARLIVRRKKGRNNVE
jgi:hypothetical protein